MDKEIKSWLSDIGQEISEIHQFLPNQTDFEAFQEDLKTKRAIERNIEIIGEAMSRILKMKPASLYLQQEKLLTQGIE